MGTQKIASQTNLTILAKLDSSKNVQLFALDNLMVLNGADKLKDKFSSTSTDSNVTVRVVSTDGAVTVSNTSGSNWTWNTGTLSSSSVTLYYAQASVGIPSEGEKTTDTFTVAVGSQTADPTVVIKRGGSGDFEVSSAPRGA